MTRFRLQLCLLTVLLCTCSRAILSSSGLPFINCTQHDHGHSLALRHTAALELKPALQDHQAAAGCRSLTQEVNSSLPQVESAPGSSNNAATPDHKPLFPISGLEVAVLVIAGVVLFIAAGKRAWLTVSLCAVPYITHPQYHISHIHHPHPGSISCSSAVLLQLHGTSVHLGQPSLAQPCLARHPSYINAVCCGVCADVPSIYAYMQVLAWEVGLCWCLCTWLQD